MLPEFQNINEEDIKLNDKLNDKALKTDAKAMNDSIDEATARAASSSVSAGRSGLLPRLPSTPCHTSRRPRARLRR